MKAREEKRKLQRRGQQGTFPFSMRLGRWSRASKPPLFDALVHVTCVVQNTLNKFRVCWAPRTNEKTSLEESNFNQGL